MPRDRDDTIRAHVPPPGHPEQDAPQPQARRRAWTGALLRSRDGEQSGPIPGWAAALLLVVLGTGGGAGVTSVLSPAIEPDRVLAVEQSVASAAQRDAEHDRELLDQAKAIAALSAKTGEAEAKLWRESARTSRWMADVLVKHSAALGAIAKQLDVDVDVAVPPMLVEVEP